MIKIVTNEDLGEMSQYLTPDFQNEPCSNCCEVRLAIKNGDVKQFQRLTNWPEEEAEGAISVCRQCLWFWVDEVEELEEEQPLMEKDIGKNPEGRTADETRP